MSILEELKKKIADIETQSLAMEGCRPTFTVSEIMDLIDSVETDKQTEESAQNVPNDELISRKTAIDEATRLFEMGDCYCDRASIVGMLNSLPSAQPEQKWTPCSNTVDIPDYEVLCCDKRGNELIGWLFYSNGHWNCESEGKIMYDTIAWMPRPKPYKERREG